MTGRDCAKIGTDGDSIRPKRAASPSTPRAMGASDAESKYGRKGNWGMDDERKPEVCPMK